MTVVIEDVTVRAEPDLEIADLPEEYVKIKISDAEAIIAAELPQVAARLTSGALSSQLYTSAVCDMVLRVLRNPQGYSYQTAGDASGSMSGVAAAGQIVLDANSIRRLTGAADGGMAGTILLSPSPGWGFPSRPRCW